MWLQRRTRFGGKEVRGADALRFRDLKSHQGERVMKLGLKVVAAAASLVSVRLPEGLSLQAERASATVATAVGIQ